MKPRIYFLLSIMLPLIAYTQEKKIPYFLPHKDYSANVVFTLTDVKVFKKGDILNRKNLLRHFTRVSIEEPIKVEGRMRWASDEAYYFDFSNLGKGGKSFSMDFGFNSEGIGTISSFNGIQEPILADIIQGTVSVASAIVTAVANGLNPMGFDGINDEKEVAIKEVQKIEVQKILNIDTENIITIDNLISGSKNYKYKFSDSTSIDFYNFITPVPTVSIRFTELSNSKNKINSGTVDGEVVSGSKIFYKIPAPFLLSATVSENLFAKQYKAIEQVVYLPQKGKKESIPIELTKGKRTLEISFNPTTGNLSKYTLKKESNLKASLNQLKSSTDELSTSIKNFQKAQFEKNKDDSEQKELEKLRLEIDKLRLLKEKKELLEKDPDGN